ncbi:putative immunity protein [Acholeplasma laidlawii]|uniref:putative immunity protein n=1 Tax=Acholeplasma laidlawii TaxID=2148 RepID=UPI00084CD6A1|nr:hypothetical protein BHS12_03395 [Acholeplasma laidlawii]
MKLFNQYKLNVYDNFIDKFNLQTKASTLVWIKHVMLPHFKYEFDLYNKTALSLIDESLLGIPNVTTARAYAFKLHELARTLENDKQFYIRALAHMVSTIHVKTHALKCCDYLIKMIQFQTKDADRVVSERLRQISLIDRQQEDKV